MVLRARHRSLIHWTTTSTTTNNTTTYNDNGCSCLGVPAGVVAIVEATLFHHSLHYLGAHLGVRGGALAIVDATVFHRS